MEEKLKFLDKCYLFSNLSEKELTVIAEQIRKQELAKDTVFIEEGLPGNEMYLITEGLVKIFRLTEDGKEITLAIKGKGEAVGELSLLDDEVRAASVQALQSTEVLVLKREDFLATLSQHSSIAINMLQNIAKVVRRSNRYVEGLLSQSLQERTWEILQTVGSYFPDRSITLSHEELALLVGATRPRITETLHELEGQGKIFLAHKSIRLI